MNFGLVLGFVNIDNHELNVAEFLAWFALVPAQACIKHDLTSVGECS